MQVSITLILAVRFSGMQGDHQVLSPNASRAFRVSSFSKNESCLTPEIGSAVVQVERRRVVFKLAQDIFAGRSDVEFGV